MSDEVKVEYAQTPDGCVNARFQDHHEATVKLQDYPHSKSNIPLLIMSGRYTSVVLTKEMARALCSIFRRFSVAGTIAETPPIEALANFKAGMAEFDKEERARFEPVRALLAEIEGIAKTIWEETKEEDTLRRAYNIGKLMPELKSKLEEAIG